MPKFVPALKGTMAATEIPLAGGNLAAEVVRIGNRVHRTPPAANMQPEGYQESLLEALPRLGFTAAPRYYGQDAQGRDVLSYCPGQTHLPWANYSLDGIRNFATMLHQLHTVTAGHLLAGDAPCVVHGDPGPWNVAFDELGLPCSLYDWDTAGPGDPLLDFAYLAWTWCISRDMKTPLALEGARLRAARDAYDRALTGETLLAAVTERARQAVAWADMRLADSTLPARAHEHALDANIWNNMVIDKVALNGAAYLRAFVAGA